MAGKPMFLQIDNYLTPAEVQDISELARQAKFIEGRRSNPHIRKTTSSAIPPIRPPRRRRKSH
jgi:hypothetical protein